MDSELKNSILKTGTTILGIVCKDGVVMAADTKATMGNIAMRKDEEKGHVRIKAAPKKEINLRKVYEKIMQLDDQGSWYYHPSGHMVLNHSKKDPSYEPTKLSLKQVIDIIKSAK